MFQRLQKKWKVNAVQLTLIICTFAIGGSVTGYAGRKLINLFEIEKGGIWIVVYLLIICLLWPLAVILVSFPFGQYRFFKKYIRKIGARLGLVPKPVNKGLHNIAIFASGTGSNAQKIIDRFRNHESIKVVLIICNNPAAGVLKIAEKEHIPALIVEKERFFRGDTYLKELNEKKTDLIVLAGFLWKLPVALIRTYSGRIINIHPALLPKYGGKGFYGNYVHKAVIANKDKESGITIHFVDEIYDHGKIIFQQKCTVMENDSAESLAQRIRVLEHKHYPEIIEETISKL
ncbi:MAG: phosphoribosylglycinamide formyltransferase [Bacteroidia bacterium]|nr:phosphoribosylglycinamide formyltransferase [Bacteroidia bacterium]